MVIIYLTLPSSRYYKNLRPSTSFATTIFRYCTKKQLKKPKPPSHNQMEVGFFLINWIINYKNKLHKYEMKYKQMMPKKKIDIMHRLK
jgi:hypothetical protein